MDSGGAFRRGESQHPEWDLMYRKGLTVKRIADLCHALPQTVGRHIRAQRALCSGMEAEHLANRPPDTPRSVGEGWQANIDALSAFRDAHVRYPTRGDPDPANRKLAHWLARQRVAERSGRLLEVRRQMLSALPGWEMNQRTVLETERWLSRLEELRVFQATEGRWPRFRTSVDEVERVLGVWLHSQGRPRARGA